MNVKPETASTAEEREREEGFAAPTEPAFDAKAAYRDIETYLKKLNDHSAAISFALKWVLGLLFFLALSQFFAR